MRTGYIPLGIEQQLYYEDLGDLKKPPLLFLHGGPGLGCDEKHRALFDLEKYRVVLHDQRGCNRSEPQGSTIENTTQNLVQDIETLRKRLKLEKITLVGSSWGTVLALAYAVKFSECVERLVLKSPFWATADDFLWTYTREGVAKNLERQWTEFAGDLQGEPLIEQYAELILRDKPDTQAVIKWVNWEGAVYFAHRPSEYTPFNAESITPYWTNVAKIQIHYLKNNFFLDRPNETTEYVRTLAAKKIPASAIQGETDWVTPLAHLQKIRQLWPNLDVHVLSGVDHKIPDEEMKKI